MLLWAWNQVFRWRSFKWSNNKKIKSDEKLKIHFMQNNTSKKTWVTSSKLKDIYIHTFKGRQEHNQVSERQEGTDVYMKYKQSILIRKKWSFWRCCRHVQLFYLRGRPAGFVLTTAHWLRTPRRCRPPARSCTLCTAADLRWTVWDRREEERELIKTKESPCEIFRLF